MCDCDSNITNSNSSVVSVTGRAIQYNYLQTTTVDLGTITDASTISADSQPGCVLVGKILTYTPPVRQKEQLIYPFTADGTQEVVLKLYPNLSVNYTQNYFIGVDTSGNFYKINALAKTEALLLGFDGLPIVIPDILTMCTDLDDGLIFYVTNAAPTTVRSYSVATGVSTNFIIGLAFSVRSIHYDNGLLYLVQSGDGTTISSYEVKYPTTFGMIANLAQTYTLVGSTRQGFVATGGLFYFGVRTVTNASAIVQAYPFGSITAVATSGTLGNLAVLSLTTTSNGRLYAYDATTKRFWSTRNISTISLEWTSAITFASLAQIPYGL